MFSKTRSFYMYSRVHIGSYHGKTLPPAHLQLILSPQAWPLVDTHLLSFTLFCHF